MLKDVTRSGIIIMLVVVLIHVTSVRGDEVYFIDAHSQVDHKVTPLEKIISIMKQGAVSHTVLSARGKQKGKTLLSFASHYPEHITPAIRTKGKSYETGSAKYYQSLEQQVANGRFSAIAEKESVSLPSGTVFSSNTRRGLFLHLIMYFLSIGPPVST